VKNAYNKFSGGTWLIVESDSQEFYIYYQRLAGLPRLMLICKDARVFSALAECSAVMYSLLHPETAWGDQMTKDIEDILPPVPGE